MEYKGGVDNKRQDGSRSPSRSRPKALELDDSSFEGKAGESKGEHGGSTDFPLKSPVPTTSSSIVGGNSNLKPFEMDRILKFHPPGAWHSKFCPGDGIPYEYHLSTSFLKPGFTISCPGGVDFIKIVCYGILTFKVLYSKEGDDQAFGSGVVLSEIEVPPASMGQRQRVEVKTPWPCMKVEAVVDQQSDDFVAIFGVAAYSTSRPSSLSTPINEGKMGGRDREALPPWGKGPYGINARLL